LELKEIISSGILELYISGLASNDENLQVQQWIQQFSEVRKELEEIQAAMESYATAYAIQPPPSTKEKIFNRLNLTFDESIPPMSSVEKTERAKVYIIPSSYKWAVAASVILLIGSLIFSYTYYSKYQSASKSLALAQTELNKQKEMAAGMSKDMDVVTDKNAMPVVLKGTPHAPDALAKIFWMKNTGEVYVNPTNLPEPTAGKQYQLWAIVDGKPVDAGMISTQKGLYKIQKMKSFGRAEAFAITLEKEGGSPTPSMEEMYVMAKIQL
jgi:anti-sigma-K factor RskA